MSKISYILFAVLLAIIGTAPKIACSQDLEDIKQRLRSGDIEALVEMGGLLDIDSIIPDFIGHHNVSTSIGRIAERTILENTFFTPEIFDPKRLRSKEQFLAFVNKNIDRIQYSALVRAFIITPFAERKVDYQINGKSTRKYPDDKKASLEELKTEVLNRVKYKHYKDIGSSLIKIGSPAFKEPELPS